MKNGKNGSNGKDHKFAYINGVAHEIKSNHTSVLKFVREHISEKEVPSLCALCGAIPTPIQNILKYFTHEFKADIKQEA